MSTLFYFLLFLGAALLVAAQQFFPVYRMLDTYWDPRPDQVFYRLAMVIAALGFWPFLKLLGINNRFALGYSLDRSQFLRVVLKGLGIGVLIMAVHTGLLFLLGVRLPLSQGLQAAGLLSSLVSGLVSGLLVALIEESFFRGALQYHLRYHNPFVPTAVITSLVYAALHFIRPAQLPPYLEVDWNSGWQLLESMFLQYRNFTGFVDSFVALFIAGLLLSLVREKTGNIALCIGIHAGWVMSIRVARDTSRIDPSASTAWLAGNYDGIIGWAAAVTLAIVTSACWFITVRRKD